MRRRTLKPVTSEGEARVSTGPDRALLAASVAFAASAGLAVGWGAGVAAPWPMPVVALIAATRAQRAGASAGAGLLCAGIGLGCVAGTLVEPVTRRPGAWSPGTRLAITANLASSAALVVAGWRHYRAARR